MLIPYLNVEGCIGIAQLEDGSYRLDFDEASRLATQDELLYALREYYCDKVDAERDRLEQAGFSYLGEWFDSNNPAVKRLMGAWAMAKLAVDAGVSAELTWTCADNSDLPMNETQMLGVIPAMVEYANRLHVKARALKRLIRASDTPEKIDITSGWPE
jgi:hypothetical protein